ncbi:MAG: ATP-binding protein [Desulfamplus sp.]|nr:ATP-binding protein [Desulfamplus sp.]
MKNLPLGINALSTMRSQDMIYVDKTPIVWELIKQVGRYFLSRPRRFGKSLLVDTLQEIFEGNESLFKGLYIHDKWDWAKIYPVIKIDFSDGMLQNRTQLDERIYEILFENADRLNLPLTKDRTIPGTFGELIRLAAETYGQRAVVLVDEYDKPILDNIENREVAREMREGLKNLYTVLKGQDISLQFVFMTGVSKFSKVSLFSGVNQLTDITVHENYATICGYTQEDLEYHFAEHLKGIELDKVKKWYNGYKWLGNSPVYNPYDILLFISNNYSYRNYWFETGNPTFLIKLFQQNYAFLPDLEKLDVTETILNSFDIELMDPITLLFQSGYLTIEKSFTKRSRMMFRLTIPNHEVKISLADAFIDGYTTSIPSAKMVHQDHLYDCLESGDINGIIKVIQRLFKSIPWRNFTNNDIADYEGYYASVLYAFFCSLDAEVIPEDIDNHGQVDMTVKLGKNIYVMEIKVVDGDKPFDMTCNPALKQIQEKGYADKYRGIKGISVHEVGLVFSKALRNLIAF